MLINHLTDPTVNGFQIVAKVLSPFSLSLLMREAVTISAGSKCAGKVQFLLSAAAELIQGKGLCPLSMQYLKTNKRPKLDFSFSCALAPR
jgi:hypothetical protein